MKFSILIFWLFMLLTTLTLSGCQTPGQSANAIVKSTPSLPAATTNSKVAPSASIPTIPTLDYLDALTTSKGELRVVTTEEFDKVIMFKDQVIYKAEEGMLLSLRGKFRIDKTDVVLLSENFGGSGTPNSTYHFITFDEDGYTVSEAFETELDITQLQPQQQGKKIILQLGIAEGEKGVAIYEDGKVTVQKQKIYQTGSAKKEDCQDLYSLYAETCVGKTNAEECGAELYSNVGAYMRSYNHFGQLGDQRLNLKAYDEICALSCEKRGQQSLPFNQFAEMVCHNPKK